MIIELISDLLKCEKIAKNPQKLTKEQKSCYKYNYSKIVKYNYSFDFFLS